MRFLNWRGGASRDTLKQTGIRNDVLGVRDLMTSVSCIYCGHKVPAGEDRLGKKTDCPACGHAITLRPKRPRRAPAAPRKRKRRRTKNWQDKSDDEIVDGLLLKTLDGDQQFMRTTRRMCAPLKPRYDDLTLFALSVTFVMLSLLSAGLRKDLIAIFTPQRDAGPLTIALAIAGLGMVLSLINVFLQRVKSKVEKWVMLVFAVVVTAGTGICAAEVMLEKGRGVLLIFPAWNLINAFLLILLFRLGLLGTECIVDRKAGAVQIAATVVSAIFLLTVCLYALKLHWAITYSIAVGYTISLHGAVQDTFAPRPSDA